MSNICHSFLATGVRKISDQKLDATEDLQVFPMEQDYVKQLLEDGEILQILHTAPLWKYFSNHICADMWCSVRSGRR